MARITSRAAWAAFLLLAGSAATAQAASYDCAKAKATDELAVCRDPQLSALDSEMAGLWYAYRQFPFLMGASGARQDEAHAFLQRRAACKDDVACLRRAYTDRIDALKQGIAGAIGMMGRETDQAEGEAAAARAGLPAAVTALYDGYGAQCSKFGGTLSNPYGVRLMATDFDADTLMDYVLNPSNLECDGAATAFCGNGGCQISIALSSAGYRDPVQAMGGQPTLVQRENETDIEIWVDSTHCDGIDRNHACWAVYSWQQGKPVARYEARPITD